MKKIYLSIIIIFFTIATFFLVLTFMPNYGPSIRIVKNGLNHGDNISFNSIYEFNSIGYNYYSGKDTGSALLQCTKLIKDKDTYKAMNFAFAQIQNNKLIWQVYLDNLGKNIKWYSKSNELHVANWVKVWSNYEIEPVDPSFDF